MISIIVPVYNVENYLLRCLDSIVQQTYTDFEAILIDDGSTDSSGAICEDFCKCDKRFRVIHQENQGLSAARNTGLSEAKGDYFCFIDSDDYMHPRMIEILLNSCKETGCDVAMSDVKETSETGISEEITINKPRILPQRQIINDLFSGQWKYLFHVVWNKLYSKNLIDNRFNNVKSEDTDYNIRIYLSIDKMAVIDSQLYYYFQREGSITNNMDYRFHQSINSILHYLSYLKYFPEDKSYEKGICLRRVIKKYLSEKYNTQGTTKEAYAKDKLGDLHISLLEELQTISSISIFEKKYLSLFIKSPYIYSLFRKAMELFAKIKS